MINLAKMDQLAKCVYFVLTKYEFLISESDQSCGMKLDNSIGILLQYWCASGILEILVLDNHVGIMAWYWWTDHSLFLCLGLISKDHGYEIGFRYDILRWINN